MSYERERGNGGKYGTGRTTSSSGSAPPGKRTLVDQLQLHQSPASTPVPARHSREEREAATAGLEGSSAPLPHGDQLQQAFGPDHDLSDVRAHVDDHAADACDTLAADAYASGPQIAFSRPPSLRLAAHEATHVVQQRSGIGGGDARHEREADAVADAVVAGRSAAPLLAGYAGASTTANAVQKQDAKTQAKTSRDDAHDLSKEDRETVLDQLQFVLGTAYTDYAMGAQQAREQIKKELEEEHQHDLAFLFLEVAIGMLFPGVGKLVSHALNKLPPNTPNKIYEVAYWLLENDRLEKGIDAVMSKAGDAGKKELSAPPKGTAEQTDKFINELISGMKTKLFSLVGLVRDMPDEALIATLMAYFNVGIEDYKQQILTSTRRFMKQVIPVRQGPQWSDGGGYTNRTEAIPVTIDLGENATAEAVVSQFDRRELADATNITTRHRFIDWISDDMRPYLLSERGVRKVIPLANVNGLDAKKADDKRVEVKDPWRHGLKKEHWPEAVHILKGVREAFDGIDAMGRKDGAVSAADVKAFADRKERLHDRTLYFIKDQCRAFVASPVLFRMAETASLGNAADGWLSRGDLDAAIKRMGG